MKTTHIIIGEAAAKVLQETIVLEETLAGEIVTLTDDYHLGPLHVNEDVASFEALRMSYWQGLGKIFAEDFISDEKKVMQTIADLKPIKVTIDSAQEAAEAETETDAMPTKEEPCRVIFWMAPNAQDVTVYYWLLQYFQKHVGLLHVISIDSLPFFNEKGILYYPKNFAQILPKEMAKCKHLIKEISPADYELDLDEWIRISEENGMVRSHEVGKKLSTRNETHFDSAIYLSVTSSFVKANKVLATAMNKGGALANEFFMMHRLKTLVAQDSFLIQGDTGKALKDFEIKSSKSETKEEEIPATETE